MRKGIEKIRCLFYFLRLIFERVVHNDTKAITTFKNVFCFNNVLIALIRLTLNCAEEAESAERRADRIRGEFPKQVY